MLESKYIRGLMEYVEFRVTSFRGTKQLYRSLCSLVDFLLVYNRAPIFSMEKVKQSVNDADLN